MLTPKERNYLLKIARESIKFKLLGKNYSLPKPPSYNLLDKRAIFVTLFGRNNDLIGCIGNLEPISSIINGVVDNAVNAAFNDPRFPPLTLDDLPNIKIEISILSELTEVSQSDFLDILEPFKHGVLIEKGLHRATFLPSVWEELPNINDFMAHLCLKAMLNPDDWKKPGMKFYLYTVEKISES